MDAVERYLVLGLRLGRHVDGLVDFYYGPEHLTRLVHDEPQQRLLHRLSLPRTSGYPRGRPRHHALKSSGARADAWSDSSVGD